MANAVRQSVDDDVATLETSRLEEGVAYDVSYNATTAAAWTTEHCDRGDGRRFGPCETDGDVTMQQARARRCCSPSPSTCMWSARTARPS